MGNLHILPVQLLAFQYCRVLGDVDNPADALAAPGGVKGDELATIFDFQQQEIHLLGKAVGVQEEHLSLLELWATVPKNDSLLTMKAR